MERATIWPTARIYAVRALLQFRLTPQDVPTIFLHFCAAAMLLVPLGLAIGFLNFNQPQPSVWRFLYAIPMASLLAIHEEIAFRGIVQNLLGRALTSRFRALLVASLVFGLAHIFHAPAPNWRFVVLASIAGFFYGNTYWRCRSLTASALVHGLINAAWFGFFAPFGGHS